MIHINFDASDLVGLEDVEEAAQKVMADAARDLTVQTHQFIINEATKKLHTRRQMFIDSLSYFPINETTWVISLEAKARWIDDGKPEGNMIDDLLSQRNPNSKPPKRAKDGSVYRVIPFKHNNGPTQSTPAQQNLLATIKKELKARNIPYGKKEMNSDGSAKLGKLHSFDIMKAPNKTHNGPGQGKGPTGQVVQGPTGIPLLQGIRVYQREIKDKAGKSSVRRDIMTFRIVSSKHKGEGGRWDHPGTPPVGLMDQGLEFAKTTWERDVSPKVLGSLVASLD